MQHRRRRVVVRGTLQTDVEMTCRGMATGVHESNRRTVQDQPPRRSRREAQPTPLRPCAFEWCSPLVITAGTRVRSWTNVAATDVVTQPERSLQRKPEHRGQGTSHPVDERPDAGRRTALARTHRPTSAAMTCDARSVWSIEPRFAFRCRSMNVVVSSDPVTPVGMASRNDQRADHFSGIGQFARRGRHPPGSAPPRARAAAVCAMALLRAACANARRSNSPGCSRAVCERVYGRFRRDPA